MFEQFIHLDSNTLYIYSKYPLTYRYIMIFVKNDFFFLFFANTNNTHEQKIIVHNTKHNGKIQHTKYLEVRQDDNFAKCTFHPSTQQIDACGTHGKTNFHELKVQLNKSQQKCFCLLPNDSSALCAYEWMGI